MTPPCPGIIPAARRLLFGATTRPETRRLGETSILTTSEYYDGMKEDYRWFRQDDLVRKCRVTNAFFTTLMAGFTTVIELIVHARKFSIRQGLDGMRSV